MKEKLIRGGIIILMVYLVVSFGRDSLELIKVQKKFESAKMEVEELSRENEELKEKKEWMESGDFVEEQVRNKLNMIKEGETVVILPEDEKNELGVEEEFEKDGDQNQVEEKENWRRWMELFF